MGSGEVIVYAGTGSSHSWAWLADLFEPKGIINTRFMDSKEFIESLSDRPMAVILSGGDGFAIGSALSGEGFLKLEEYIAGGGIYAGICAGAYLPLPSSLEPFSQFNISTTRIENIDCKISPLEGVSPRVAVKYGRCAIVHPVRGEVDLDHDGSGLKAPIYGGPVFKEPQTDRVLLRYGDFTPNTEFQSGERLARDIVLGHPAAIRCSHGDGVLLLFGPHLEHPSYPEANRLFLDLLNMGGSRTPVTDPEPHRPEVARSIADLKVAIVGLENRSFIVGRKLWDGSRYMELVHAIEKRTWSTDDRLSQELVRDLETVRGNLIGVNMGVESEVDQTTQLLVECARRCVDNHFRRLVESR
jgi:hypothetical protein